MTPTIRPRDAISTAAAAELIRSAAQAVIDANAARTDSLTAIAADTSSPLTALQAYQAYVRAETSVAEAEATYMATLSLWGITRYGVAAAVGCRPATITRRIGQHPLALARGCDLQRLDGGGWTVSPRSPKPEPEAEVDPNAPARVSTTEPVDADTGVATEPFDATVIEPVGDDVTPEVLAAALAEVDRDLKGGL